MTSQKVQIQIRKGGRACGKVHFSGYTVGTLGQFLCHHAYKIFGESRHDGSFRALSCLLFPSASRTVTGMMCYFGSYHACNLENKKQVERFHLLRVYKYVCGVKVQRRRPGNFLCAPGKKSVSVGCTRRLPGRRLRKRPGWRSAWCRLRSSRA